MQSTPQWQFDSFRVDAQESTLWRGDEPVAVTRKALVLLMTLLGRPGSLFTKAELFETVWAGSVVSDAALSRLIHELRVALGDDAGAPRYIATAHRLGFRFIAPVVFAPAAGAGEPLSLSASSSRSKRLVGRDEQLDGLDDALVKVRAGQRQVVLVTGEAGIGKTALVQAFIDRHAGHGDLRIAQGRCVDQYGPGEAHLPILEALEQLSAQVGTPAMLAVLLRYAPNWLAQLPWLAQDAGAAAPAAAEPGEVTPQRMLREITQALEVLAAQVPMVLWLEDLHWSDPSSLALIAFLAGRRDPARLMLIGSFRPADAQLGGSPLRGLGLRLTQRGQASEIELGLLDAAAVTMYLQQRLGPTARVAFDELGAFVHRRTEGHALFVVATVDDLVARGALQQDGGDWSLRGPVAELGIGLAGSLLRLVNDRIERLAADDRRLVEAAAVAGADFSVAALAAALQATVADTEERCARLAAQGQFLRSRASVAWPDGTLAPAYGFLHAVYWQGVHEQVPLSRRADWHRRIGLRQEQAYGAQCSTIAAELAMRFEIARDNERTLRYLEMAGAGALSRCAYPECIELLRNALALVGERPAEQQARLELDLLLPLGAALMAAQGYASNEVDESYRRALQLCAVCGRPGELERVTRGQWNVSFLRADLAGALALAAKLLQLAEQSQDTGLAFDAHTKLGQTCLHLGDLAGARRHLEHALALPAAGDGVTHARGLPRLAVYLAWAHWYSGFADQARQHADSAVRLANAADSPHSTVFALGYASWIHFLCGDVTQALELARRQAVLSSEHGITYWRVLAEFTQGRGQTRQGDALAGIAAMRTAIDAMRGIGGKVGLPYLLCLLAEVQTAAGRSADARTTLDEVQSLAGNGNALYAAEALRLEGELALPHPTGAASAAAAADAERSFDAAIGLARSQGARAFELRATMSLARLWVGGPRRAEAAALLSACVAGFSEGFGTEDLRAARRLLADLEHRADTAA